MEVNIQPRSVPSQRIPGDRATTQRIVWWVENVFIAQDHTDLSNWPQFLDVYVPNGIEEGDNVPVLVWLYGGGYSTGSKDDIYVNPEGLFHTAQKPMVFVALNYR
jgi:carboxylesterase type B